MGATGGKWKKAVFLSLILPVGLFTGLRLAGVGPSSIAAITLNPVAWQFNRTVGFTAIDDILNATYNNDSVSMNFSVSADHYVPSVSVMYTLSMEISFAATPLNGTCIRSVFINFGTDPQPSAIAIDTTAWTVENLSLADRSQGSQASIQLLGNGSSVDVSCWFLVYWHLFTPTDVTSIREITYDVTYSNGAAYFGVVQPFDLTLLES